MTTTHPIKRRAIALGALAATVVAGRARSQPAAYPNRPVRMLVPFPPAGSLDNVGRVVAQRLQERLGQPFVVENRAGAGGHIGAELVARAPADGYTLLFAGTWLAIAPSLQKLAYDAPRDLAGVSMLSLGSFVLVAQRAQPFSTFQAFLSAARAQPGRLSYGSQGNGSGPHLSMAWLSELAGISLLHVPYKGSAQNVQAVLSGEVNVAFEPAITVLPHLRAGTLKALAVGSPTPLATLPDVPPVAAIYPGFDTDGWQALFAPAGTPADVRQRLSAEIARVMAMPEVVSMLRNLGTEPLSSSPDQVDTMLRAQIASWGRIIRQNGIKAD